MMLLWKLLVLLPLMGCLAVGSGLQSPVFTKQPGSIVFPVDSLEKSREVVFSCEAQGSPPPFYRWRLNGSIIDPTSGSHYTLSGGNLRISHLNKDRDAGTYQCLASNSFGTIISREASLTFAYLENFKTHRRSSVSVREGQGVVLLCGPPSHSGGQETDAGEGLTLTLSGPDVSHRRGDSCPAPQAALMKRPIYLGWVAAATGSRPEEEKEEEKMQEEEERRGEERRREEKRVCSKDIFPLEAAAQGGKGWGGEAMGWDGMDGQPDTPGE
ncbi:hypothetical protein ACEWY4_013743 [Coilia grayii]|uniref:Ig-like domain-containing protein n=1 Tax=Coilia grayii TaxID=363190 RepID=A0ABD1JX63_9TELE